LFLAGELKNTLPQNYKFLDNFANFLKKAYYSTPAKSSPETSLKNSLKKANEFLERIMKSGDVSWLGNLNLAILNLTPYEKKWWLLNTAMTGIFKVLLLREGQIIDVGKNLELQDLEPYPLKLFTNIVSGKLAENDVLLVLTKEVFDFFSTRFKPSGGKSEKAGKSLLQEIAGILPFDEKRLTNVLKQKEKELLKISGICVLLFLTRESWEKKKGPRFIAFQKEREKFSLKLVFLPFIKKLKRLNLNFKRKLTELKESPKKILKSGLKTKKTEIKFSPNLRRNLILVFLLIFFLGLGFFVSKKEGETKLKRYQFTLTSVREEISKADNFLTLENKKKAFEILKKSREDILPLTKEKSSLQKEALSLQNSLEERLEKISNLEKISEPELFFEFNPREFIPQKMELLEGNFYFYNPFADNVYKLTEGTERSVLKINQQFTESAVIGDSLLFFQKPNLIFLSKNDRFENPLLLKSPYQDFAPQILSTYRLNLYFLDGGNGEVVKYPEPLNRGKDSPQIWLNPATKKALEAKSMATNGNVWILNKDNSVSRYFGGDFKETLNLLLFPYPKELSKIASQADSLYLLEPVQNRVIILAKTGEILKQFQSEKFDTLKDFALSKDGKTIWLLNGSKVYRIKF
jgi:hypothetical protein